MSLPVVWKVGLVWRVISRVRKNCDWNERVDRTVLKCWNEKNLDCVGGSYQENSD